MKLLVRKYDPIKKERHEMEIEKKRSKVLVDFKHPSARTKGSLLLLLCRCQGKFSLTN